MESLDENGSVENEIVTCKSSIGNMKNVIGKTILFPRRIYSFSYRIVNSFTCLIGVIAKQDLESLKNK